MTNTLEQISSNFLDTCHDEYVDLCFLRSKVMEGTGETDPQEVRGMTITILKDLLHEDLIKSGYAKC